jgi:RNA polymerase sigma-70 factor (ECF subfamily)
MSLDDAAIERFVNQAKSGDADAFGQLFDHYHEPIYRFVASRVYRPTDAEDLTQIVFVKALEALPRYEARGVPFGGWLFRLARNAVIDFVRTRHDHVELDAIGQRSAPGAQPDELILIRDEIDAVGVALAALTDEQRDAISLRFFSGLSAREAAEAMGKQEGTVRGLQFRAIAALRRQLGVEVFGGLPAAKPIPFPTAVQAAQRRAARAARAAKRDS